MSTAKREGGLYYTTAGQPVDADGIPVQGAPKIGKDTPPDQQPGGANTPTPEERAAIALAKALQNPQAVLQQAEARDEARRKAAAADDENDGDEQDGLPPISGMEAHLAGIDNADEVKALRKSDKRKGAKPLYAARLRELEGSGE